MTATRIARPTAADNPNYPPPIRQTDWIRLRHQERMVTAGGFVWETTNFELGKNQLLAITIEDAEIRVRSNAIALDVPVTVGASASDRLCYERRPLITTEKRSQPIPFDDTALAYLGWTGVSGRKMLCLAFQYATANTVAEIYEIDRLSFDADKWLGLGSPSHRTVLRMECLSCSKQWDTPEVAYIPAEHCGICWSMNVRLREPFAINRPDA